MTNGEKIKEIFPSTDSRLDEKTGIMLVKWVDGATKCFKADWWNAEYKEPTTKNNLGVDCISRADAIRVASGYCHPSNVAKELAKLPSVTPQEPKWIPCSERLPKEDGEYLLFGKINEDEENYIFVGEYDSCGEQFGIWQEQFDRVTLGCLGSEFFEYSCVIAWMPLPKPYKESEGV